MDTRREFLKKAGLLSGLAGMHSLMPESIRKALQIEPTVGSRWKDAEHIVILMQENRSFDHCFGTLRGVRGFNDPRAIRLPNGNPVWLQSNEAGETYAPFHLDMRDTKSTWMSSLPHAWNNQVNARNDGKYDRWLPEKRSGVKEFADMPLTMGYYDRADIPFYYELADAFTVCDQHFCSALTGTDPNRLYFWTGAIREEQNEDAKANVWNEDMDYEAAHWKTFPEELEDHDISWKFYQNEISIDTGFKTEEEYAWLSNFQDNPLEFFSQYNVLQRLDPAHHQYLIDSLPVKIAGLQKQLESLAADDASRTDLIKSIESDQNKLEETKKELDKYDIEKYKNLSAKEKALHEKAFVTNKNDPNYLTLESFTYDDNGTQRTVNLPKGDLLYQFREDVKNGALPMVSWLAAPENLSDHPAAAWYGAWYVSEVLDILTKNPEVWKKTIFILTYDENDGYFDHVPPFVAPHSGRKETGAVSEGLDTRVEWVTARQEKERKGFPQVYDRESPIGLGYRVPMIIASPWSRGGYVNSEIFDHTSTLQFLETFIKQKTGKLIHTPNISEWRRMVCGDLTSVFRKDEEKSETAMQFVKRDVFMESVYSAKFKKLPSDYHALTPDEINRIKNSPLHSPYLPQQEKGTRPSCALEYQLYADGYFDVSKNAVEVSFRAGNDVFGIHSLGSPFYVYAPGRYMRSDNSGFEVSRSWAFAVEAAGRLSYGWPIEHFENGIYHLQVYGPNGFFREYKGSQKDPDIIFRCEYQRSLIIKNKLTGNLELQIVNNSDRTCEILIIDNAYGASIIKKQLATDKANSSGMILPIDCSRQSGWYDFTVKITGFDSFEKRYAGRVETGEHSISDPFMGGVDG